MAAKTFAFALCLLAAAHAQSDAVVPLVVVAVDSSAVVALSSDVAPLVADASDGGIIMPTLSAADPSPSSDAQPLRRALLQGDTVEAPSEASDDADALVTGFTAYNIDAQISAKLAASAAGNATALYESSFRGVCTSLCRPHASNTSLDAGRRMLELCDNCWCRQNRPCTVSAPYGVCMACMDDWSACAPATSHYTTTDPANLRIRAACEAKKPIEAAEALSGTVPDPPNVNVSLLADGTVVAGTPPARKLLRA